MSRANQILTLMADGRKYTNTELCKITGLSKREIDSVIGQLRQKGRVATVPVVHSITPSGTAALRSAKFYPTRKDLKKSVTAEPIAETAVRNRCPLQQVWGAAA